MSDVYPPITVINLTPHEIRVHGENGVTVYPASGTVARVAVKRQRADGIGTYGKVFPFPIYWTRYGEVTNLPKPTEGTYYIVSAMVKVAVPNRVDVFSPGELVRDSEGNPTGCKGLDVIDCFSFIK